MKTHGEIAFQKWGNKMLAAALRMPAAYDKDRNYDARSSRACFRVVAVISKPPNMRAISSTLSALAKGSMEDRVRPSGAACLLT
jgi:hypothetical protein